jgi:hybrid cluster-associated redox disulfide protein
MKKITKEWPIAQLLNEYPESVEVLLKYGFPCIGCAMSQFESIGQGIQIVHGKDEKVMKKLLKELNDIAQKDTKQSKKK